MLREASLDGLHPVFRQNLRRILAELKKGGWEPIVAQTIRTPRQQAEKVKRGVSWTMHSWHVPSTMATLPYTSSSYLEVRGNAADVVDRRYGWEGPAHNHKFAFWLDLGRIAKQYGCEWGGDWNGKQQDVAHIQMKFIEMAPQRTAVV